MKYRFNELKEINDSRSWKLTYIYSKFGCPICGPNSGCNRRRKKQDESWKRHRKTQYKNETKTDDI